MTEFSTLVGVTLVDDTTKNFQFLADEFTFEPSPTDDNGGVFWDCGKTFVVDMPESEALRQLKIPRKAIVTLSKLTRMRPEYDPNVTRMEGKAGVNLVSLSTESSPNEVQIGTEGLPARVYLSPHLNKAQLVVSCKMLRNPLA